MDFVCRRSLTRGRVSFTRTTFVSPTITLRKLAQQVCFVNTFLALCSSFDLLLIIVGISGGVLLIDTHDSEIAHNVLVDGNDNLVLLGSDRNSIHHNEIRKGRHSILALKCRFVCVGLFVLLPVAELFVIHSSYNHVHHNQMSNEIQKVMEMYDCGGSSEQRFAGLVGDKPCEFNVVEDNVFGVTPVDDGDGP
jgi:hypothetical protein